MGEMRMDDSGIMGMWETILKESYYVLYINSESRCLWIKEKSHKRVDELGWSNWDKGGEDRDLMTKGSIAEWVVDKESSQTIDSKGASTSLWMDGTILMRMKVFDQIDWCRS